MKSKLALIIIFILVIITIPAMVETVDAGHVKIGSLYGDVDMIPLEEGIHLVNPLKRYSAYDCRQKTQMFENIGIPSRDQLTSSADVSIQWHIDRVQAATILLETGDAMALFTVHIEPKTRSIIRELGKSVENAEDFFQKDVQIRLQSELKDQLVEYCASKGIIIDAVLLRRIEPPAFVLAAIEKRKVREQLAEEQVAELARFKVEQEQLVETAKAQKSAAEETAKTKVILADAQAYEIQKINEAIADNPAYVKLEAIKAMTEISKNPANQIYFLNSDSQQPLPLMHMGDAVKGSKLKGSQ
jgi:regulator of protease activity HflC (stomatin/prohibitin superfamily)